MYPFSIYGDTMADLANSASCYHMNHVSEWGGAVFPRVKCHYLTNQLYVIKETK